jgi:hypothetical protein
LRPNGSLHQIQRSREQAADKKFIGEWKLLANHTGSLPAA